MIFATSAPGLFTRDRLLLGGLGLAVLLRLWVLPIGSSLWLDEFGTWWVSNGSLAEILSRARLFPQSVLYAAIVWLTRALGGSSEIVLRVPSLLAAGLAGYCVYRLGRDLLDRETGLLAAAIFIGDPEICFAAGDARPYAFAVLASIAALWMLVRWLEGGRALDAAAYVLCASAAVYFQYLFASMLIVHAAYAIRRCRRGCAVRARPLLLVASAIGILTAPATAMAFEASRDAGLHAFTAMPGTVALLKALLSTGVLAALLGSVLVCWALGLLVRWPARSAWSPPIPAAGPAPVSVRDALWLLSLSAVIPAALLFAGSRVSGVSVFVARYMLCMIPAQALLLAWFVRGLRPISGQPAVVAGYLLIMLLARGLRTTHAGEDWRSAITAVEQANGSRPVLLSGTYTESRNLAWVRDDAHAAYMRAPLHYYASAGRSSILPLLASPEAEAYVLDSVPALEDQFALIERSSRFPSWAPWLQQRLRPRGYRMRRVWDGNPSAWVFERAGGG